MDGIIQLNDEDDRLSDDTLRGQSYIKGIVSQDGLSTETIGV
jgi:hypothetical protein